MDIEMFDFEQVNVNAKLTTLKKDIVLRVVKSNKIMEFDENTYAKVTNFSFHNGIIEVKMLSRLLSNAPSFARGFIGIAFRINDDDSKFESFYIRPTNGHSEDPTRKNRAVQYFSYPNYTFEYFRNLNIADYEGSADIKLNEWITLKAIIQESRGEFYINNNETPSLVVENMKLGEAASGSIGLFVDIGTEAFFKDLKIIKFD
ncbi:hypothetical protein HMPREF9517_00042 [Enterococcus faecalis TX1341]|uniref:hypothetical protein n=1 Tax=Enterococcus TaxID=1350 RepID=UPI0001F0D94A|nr:hypothetical protein [Enterococcus faecalis]EFU13291.1 hypothetical protein HMPREF9517_00042 [Enterococcus faecalis TX1341]EGO2640111.1 hypothetical protein [Enterococcus faecalis]EGO2713216.1 hypothetical protein [Enterococcus faecalis]EGO6522715.1 hypothetical protein [Enterococcus faecalis]EGO7802556.1 hypothetical protein [Enterococcus faecalis]